jgi:hypothetical protein
MADDYRSLQQQVSIHAYASPFAALGFDGLKWTIDYHQ